MLLQQARVCTAALDNRAIMRVKNTATMYG
jgi:hypothetical protein